MKITFLGHASFRIEIADQTLLIDPWLTGNPVLPEDQHQAAVTGATHILLTHAHFDHIADVVRLSKELNVPLVGQYDLMGWLEESEGLSIVGFNKGGTVTLGDVAVTMVNAVHSSTTRTENGLQAMGSECGFMIEAEGRTIYVSGDTDVMADMELFNDLHEPEIGILACGGHFTMDMRRAAYAANKFFNFTTIIPCHYRTFPILEQSAQVLIDEVPSARVIEPEVMVPFTL
ncbi:MAG: metal-dependent hydrolase [Rhodobacteraceae bacterium]|nr:metal-dependent hydrolase [Paracoccaceae bacterium]NCW03603.1 metal-dependent hydrolase [Paracoccaceae bacterium]NCW60299.1 metal-dependent hydrolase [Paracoccaceae bacterium]NCW64966.1 metal-dependent hydrolase [Paracoccaceae bacterium]NCX07343.1 metal-dependent hydrolase [Paracoccaceae bacterium]